MLSRSIGSDTGVKSEPIVSSLKRPRQVQTRAPDCHPDDVVGVYHTMEQHLELSQKLLWSGDMTHRLPDDPNADCRL